MKARKILAMSALALLMAEPVFAASPSNVFLSGNVFKGGDIITSFATPILLGNTLPVRDQVPNGSGGMNIVKLALTPESFAENVMTVSVKADWSSQGAPSDAVAGGMINERVELAQGESKTISFGNCGHAEDKLSSCTYKLVFSAIIQR